MTMSVNAKMASEGDAVYYSAGWKLTVETHLNYIKEVSANNVVGIIPADAYKYEADLFGLLQKLRVETRYHWVVMRLNDMTSPNQFRVDRTFLLLPDYQVLERLRQVHQTTSKKKIN